jgi:PAS domain S-box-containing protein
MSDESNYLYSRPQMAAELLNYSFDACLICTLEHRELKTVYANQTYFDLTGFSESETLGQPPKLTSRPGYGDSVHQKIVDAFYRNEPFEKEHSGLTKSGNPFWAIIKSKQLSTKSDETPHIVLLLKEITTRKKREGELRKAVDNAESSKVVKERFLANMSHEMRTPLNGILGMAQLLEGSGLNQDQAEHVDEIKHAAENLLAIVNDILEFNFIKSGKMKPERRLFDIRKQTRQLFELMKERTEKRNVEMNLVVAEKVPEKLVGDSVRLNQVLMNILSNAIKFTKNGEISVFVTPSGQADHRIFIEFTIRDTGIGIPEALVDDIFDSFNQASKSTTYKYGGSGMGLAIVKEIVGYMDGTIEVDSKEGEGTRFNVVIPFELPGDEMEEEPGPDKMPAPKMKPEFMGHRALVVDDYKINRRIVCGLLERLGVEVDEAETGEEALKKVQMNNYSIVYMDVHMPGMGGHEATRKIRQFNDTEKRSVPVIAITASVLDSDVEKSREAGMDGFLAKPFTLDQLVQAFREHVLGERESDRGERAAEKVNLDALEEMTAGDPAMMKEMVELFLNQTPLLTDKINSEFQAGNMQEVKVAVHTLKPTLSYVGMHQTMELAAVIEMQAGEDKPDMKRMEKEIDKLSKACNQAVSQLGRLHSAI